MRCMGKLYQMYNLKLKGLSLQFEYNRLSMSVSMLTKIYLNKIREQPSL